jgi:septal ring factor EnvC (AmiA/AmiB activator)
MEINRIKKILEERDGENMHLTTQLNMAKDRLEEIEAELEMKNGENNRLRKQVVDLEKTMQDLYCSRKGNGSLQIELDSLKGDNERLLELLRGTCEYADMDDNDIIKAANSLKSKLAQPKGGKGSSVKSNGTRSTKSLKSA